MTREEKLELALDKNTSLINEAQNYIRDYLIPDGAIKTESELVSELIYLFDSPLQREAFNLAVDAYNDW